ncbi:mediator of RNA polymerase II transcription subunit 26 isoform X2 [Orussus abietinus]|nr:mediator of RNA polymerase II transcription subunit 26 isoform X2 [Orussus abietinus]XP_012283097.1 mediator of RNA polymerase II transcription subunit 26 isoform X2 [Orussus abietinus]XP_012283099.1 mediator of RNA polymerase II transcription subunit 26 isoform X2 [Orussus abietinus]
MGAVVDVITALEKTTITKEVLEVTRLGKYINELRRKTSNDALAKRAKDLVRRWRDMVLPSAHSTPQPTPADTAPPALNGAKPQSPALRGLRPQSPSLKGLKPQSPLLRDATPLQVLSPTLSVHSDRSRSPNATPTKPTMTTLTNHRLTTEESPKLRPSCQNHTTEAVPRTHSSNKRLRKDESEYQPPQQPHRQVHRQQHQQKHHSSSMNECAEPAAKKQRLNGESATGNAGSFNSQVPSPATKELLGSGSVGEHPARESRDARASPPAEDELPGPKKRGRKKGSKSLKKQPLLEDRVKEKLASISRNPKLKTTQELLADLQARGSNAAPATPATSATPAAAAATAATPAASASQGTDAPPSQTKEPPSIEDILRGSDEQQVTKYLKTPRANAASRGATAPGMPHTRSRTSENVLAGRPQPFSRYRGEPEVILVDDDDEEEEEDEDDDDGGGDGAARKRPSSPRQELTVEEILAKLPPLDPSAIRWSDDEQDAEEEGAEGERRKAAPARSPRRVTPEDVERLQRDRIEGVNGNFQPKLSSLTRLAGDGGDAPAARTAEGADGETEFREWHEMLAKPSYNGQILHILPYVIID